MRMKSTAQAGEPTRASVGMSRATQPVHRPEPPRISLAALAAMNTTSSPAKVKTRKTKSAGAPKAGRASPSAIPSTKVAKPAKSALVTENADDTTDSGVSAKRKLKGIRLAQNPDGADALQVLTLVAAPMAQIPAPEIPHIPPTAPAVAPPPSCLATLWSCLQNPSRGMLATLTVLTIALAVVAAGPNDTPEAAAPVATTQPLGPGYADRERPATYYQAGYRPYAGPDYRSQYHYR